MKSCFGLRGFADHPIAYRAKRKQFGFSAQGGARTVRSGTASCKTPRSGAVVFRSVTKPNMRSHAMKRSASALGAC